MCSLETALLTPQLFSTMTRSACTAAHRLQVGIMADREDKDPAPPGWDGNPSRWQTYRDEVRLWCLASNLKVKHLCVYQLFPKLVNLTVPFLKFEQSEAFLKMMLRASRIKWGEGLSKNNFALCGEVGRLVEERATLYGNRWRRF